MSTTTRLDIDLGFELTLPNESTGDTVTGDTATGAAETITGKVSAAGTEVTVECSNPAAFLGTRIASPAAFRAIAEVLAAQNITVAIRGPEGLVVRFGQLKSSLVQRLLTGTRHIELGTTSALASLLVKRASMRRLELPSLIPPQTPIPLLPTFLRRRMNRITTTHYAYGAGHPRLIFVVDSERWDGTPARTFDLHSDVTTLGSSPRADLVLAGAQPFHAEIRHTKEDEYVLFSLAPVGTGIDPSATTESWAEGGVVLRTGARIQIGNWKMAFFREEYADHGRPHGGRAGGEWERQKPQPARPIY